METGVVCFKIKPWNSLGGTEKSPKNLGYNIPSPEQQFNRLRPEYKARRLATTPCR